ncbi:hypothetical protein LCGC14_0401820 [marine sediment metagenome]|uniref:dATP/dGTP diphosphohydrolase N-terminal domain-containing protein n=1 Tax=marine sediment metagenome TaxID=412755 RepID=A0A0F9T2D1_9ZZZZ
MTQDDRADKFDIADERVRVDLLPSHPLVEIAKVLTHGAGKYGADNWRRGLEWRRYYGAVMRHMLAWEGGEDLDPDSGLSHLACAGCNVLFLIEMARTRPDLDDRFKYKAELIGDSDVKVRYLPRSPLQTGGIAHGADPDTDS